MFNRQSFRPARRALIGAALIALAAAPNLAAAQTAPEKKAASEKKAAPAVKKVGPPPSEAALQETPPGEGVLCAWAIYSVVAEVGRRCHPGQDAPFQAELDRSVGRMESFIEQNSDAKPADLAAAKARQIESAAKAKGGICSSDVAPLYPRTRAAGPQHLREGMDRLLSRPGKPTSGPCL